MSFTVSIVRLRAGQKYYSKETPGAVTGAGERIQ